MSFLMSLDSTTLLLGCVPVLLLLWWLSTRRPPGIPPGPGPALPLLGHLHLMDKNPLAQFKQWRREYGDVFSLYFGGRLVVVLNGYPAIKEALVKFADVFSDRPHIFINDKLFERKGIMGSSGRLWKEQRKASLEILREFGMGKNILAEKLQEEITHYIRTIEDFQGAPVDLSDLTASSVSNNICSIVFGKRFDYKDPTFNNFLSYFEEAEKLLAGTGAINIIPMLEYVPGDPFKAKRILDVAKLTNAFIRQVMADNLKADMDEESTNFIHAYGHEIRKQKATGNTDTTINEDNLERCVFDLFTAGTETTTTTLRWALLLFLHYPEVQDKCYKEICDVVGPDQTPGMRHRQHMTYLEATILELLRKGDILPMAGPHVLTNDVVFQGYTLPKDTMVIPNLNSAHQDPEVWGDPERFRPERFIGPDGKVKREENLIPFGIGRRVCVGESLARMELFLYLSNLVQHFRFLPPDDGPMPPLEPAFGMTQSPQHHKVRAVARN